MTQAGTGRRPQRPGVGHRIEIAAPIEAVWRVLADLDGWSEWNPLYVAAQGSFVAGSTVTMSVALEGMKPQPARATVVTVAPPRLIEYEIVSLGGLVRAFRYIEVERLDSRGTAVRNGEIMSGAIGVLLGKAIGERVRKGLEGMNRALKRRVEAGEP